MDNSDRVAISLGQVLEKYARDHAITVQEAFNLAMKPSPNKKWGNLPHQYDPSKDPDHPSNGFRIDR
jgi:hypothetical protein